MLGHLLMSVPFPVELLDLGIQQSGKLETKDKMAKLQEQLSSEKTVVSKLKYALSRTQLELEDTLKVQHKHIKDLEAFRYPGLL